MTVFQRYLQTKPVLRLITRAPFQAPAPTDRTVPSTYYYARRLERGRD
jgi:hypothetical protein